MGFSDKSRVREAVKVGSGTHSPETRPMTMWCPNGHTVIRSIVEGDGGKTAIYPCPICGETYKYPHCSTEP
jgi:hypothetical protein